MAKLRPFPLLPLTLLSLVSCGGQESPKSVVLDMGSYIGYHADKSHTEENTVTPIAYSQLKTLVTEERSFLLLVRGSSSTCACWHTFLNNCLGPYVQAKHLLVYQIALEALEREQDRYGLSYFAGYDTMAIFDHGKLEHQKSYAEDEKFGTDATTFNTWMNARIDSPKVFYVSQTQLDALYEGVNPLGKPTSRFALYFGRDTCPDCGYLSRFDLRDYFAQRKTVTEPLYYFDADAWKGDAYEATKAAYGLAGEDSPYAYEGGAFPALLSVVPNAGEKIATIDQFGIFYNDKVKDGTVTQSYFSAARLADPEAGLQGALSYAQSVSPNMLEGQPVDASASRHEALRPYTKPLVYALLDAIL